MENYEKYINLHKLNIKAELMFDMMLSLKYEIVFKTDYTKDSAENVFDFKLFFDMPKSAVIEGFELDYGDYSVKSYVAEFDDEEKSEASKVILKQLTDTCYSFKINNLNKNFGEFNLIIEATALPKFMGNDLIFEIPLYSSTSAPKNVEPDKRNSIKAKNIYSENIDISISVAVPNNKELKRVYSSTHEYNILPDNKYIMKDNNYIGENHINGGIKLISTGKSGGLFELCLCYDPSRESVGYVCGDEMSGFSAVYLLKPHVPEPVESSDIVYLLDTTNLFTPAHNIAKLALTEFLRNMERHSYFFISTTDGGIYSNEFLVPSTENVAKVEDWLRKLKSPVKTGEQAYKDAVQKVFDMSNSAQVIFITASGLLCRHHNLQNMIIENVYKSGQTVGSAVQHSGKLRTTFNIVSTGPSVYNGFYEEFSRECLGIFGQMHCGHNFCSFVSGFLERLCSPYLSNVVISEFAPGTYYMNPKEIKKYRTEEPIILGMRSATDYPKEFLIEADGGFSQTVNVDNIKYLNRSRSIDMAFARLALDGIYKLISRSDIAPETVIRFKKIAAQITKEMNVLSPENSCRADIYTKYGHGRSIGDVNIELSYSFDDEFENAVTVFGDSSLDYKTAAANIKIAVAALLACVRTDGAISSSYETNFIKRVKDTAYAVSALEQVSKHKILGSDKKFNAVINNAYDFALKKNISLSEIPIVFDSKLQPPAQSIISEMNVVEISRLILSILSGMSLV